MGYLAGLLGLALFVVLLVRSNAHDIVHVNAQAGWKLLWLVPYRGVYFSIFAIGWWLLLNSDTGAPRATFGYLFWVTGVREAIDRLLPVASVGGAFAGVRLMGWRGFDRVRVTASILAEIVLTLWASYLFAALGFLLWLQTVNAPGARTLWLALLGTLPVPLASLLLLRHGRLFARLQRGLSRVVGIERLSGRAHELDGALQSLLRRSGILSLAGLLQLGSLLSASLEVWLALRWFGHPVGVAQAVILEAATQAVRHLAFFVPAALGVQEAGLIAFGQLLGVSPELALALSLAKRMREILCGVPYLISWQWLEALHTRHLQPRHAHP